VWNTETKQTEKLERYQISVAINGASGSPVFVRPAFTSGPVKDAPGEQVFNARCEVAATWYSCDAWVALPDSPVAKRVQADPVHHVHVGGDPALA
jgi:hypothetical protein